MVVVVDVDEVLVDVVELVLLVEVLLVDVDEVVLGPLVLVVLAAKGRARTTTAWT